MTHPIPDRFRVGETWQSPRGRQWRVERTDVRKGVFLRSLHNRYTTQWRREFAIGDNMMNAWLRIDPPHEATK
jgi:hypothetical protein